MEDKTFFLNHEKIDLYFKHF